MVVNPTRRKAATAAAAVLGDSSVLKGSDADQVGDYQSHSESEDERDEEEEEDDYTTTPCAWDARTIYNADNKHLSDTSATVCALFDDLENFHGGSHEMIGYGCCACCLGQQQSKLFRSSKRLK